MITLGWIRNGADRLKTFVANRINKILEVTEERQWCHVASVDNFFYRALPRHHLCSSTRADVGVLGRSEGLVHLQITSKGQLTATVYGIKGERYTSGWQST